MAPFPVTRRVVVSTALAAAVWVAAASARQEPAAGAAPRPFAEFVEQLKADAVARGISAEVAARALDGLEPLPVVVERDRGQAEAVLSIDEYVQRRLTAATVRKARRMAVAHHAVLAEVGKAYGVQPRYLVAVWGLESNFGAFTGVRPTVQALATLAYDGRRGELFRNELFDALRIVERGHTSLDRLKGSWAGAMGQPQFMPSSYLKYAEDFNGDGERDIWSTPADVFASIANYLKGFGWDGAATWGREVRLPAAAEPLRTELGTRTEGCRAERALSPRRPLADWRARGVRAADGTELPSLDREASLLDTGGRHFLVYGNYEALLGYNCANAYALSVGLLGDRLSTP